MKTVGQSISEYAEAFRKENGNMEAARILHGKLENLYSIDGMREETIIRCIAEEIDHIICGHMEVRK